MDIQLLESNEVPPMDLLLLADPSQEMIDNYMKRGQCYIAKAKNKIVGVYVLLPITSRTIELVNIAIDENEQGRGGFGKQLVMHAIDSARKQGYGEIKVGTGNSSIAQLAFYQKCGFRITGIDKDFFTRNYSEKIIENGIVCQDMIRLTMDLL
ncbi:GNAT family N-acetyltransferase [Virgibacillus ndiopensis]|uniref:GNAT family N-acetyltransferase n=1 Tax=Virgibacillus ndiopensis TaxID=2004408 RepID=UPI000C076112|nr:GNAT family N-acetyltransferase [Virgibacillus ndiopensis]